MSEVDDKDFAYLMLLYDEIYKCALEVKDLIEKNELNELENTVRQKGELITKAVNFEKRLKLSPSQTFEQMEVRGKISLLEKENIDTLKIKREEVRKTINEVSKESSLKSAYTFSESKSGFSVDVSE